MFNEIIGLGNCGTQIIKELASSNIANMKLFAIDSVLNHVEMNDMLNFDYKCIVSDESQGSGRDRSRGAAMFELHDENGEFDNIYEAASNAKSPVIVVTSAAGGTGSGSVVPLCKRLLEQEVSVIPVIIYPNDQDPMAYHLNANDLLIELGELGILTYSIFVNPANTTDYTNINQEVVDLIHIILGRKYLPTKLDSIDDSDLNQIMSVPGRFIAFSVKAPDVPHMKKELARKLCSGYQPNWTEKDASEYTFMEAFSLNSMFASTEYEEVFADIKSRIKKTFDEYKNVVDTTDGSIMEATVIVAGLPRHQVKEITSTFDEVKGISDGMKRSTRPNFMGRKKPKPFVKRPANTSATDLVDKVNWDE